MNPSPAVSFSSQRDRAYMNPNVTERIHDPDVTDDDRIWATFIHVGAFGGLVLPLASILVPLIIWLAKRQNSPFIDDHGKESVNFQISLVIWYVVAGILVPVCGIGFLGLIALSIMALVTMILNGIRANRGEYVRYPMTIRFLS